MAKKSVQSCWHQIDIKYINSRKGGRLRFSNTSLKGIKIKIFSCKEGEEMKRKKLTPPEIEKPTPPKLKYPYQPKPPKKNYIKWPNRNYYDSK